MKTTITAAVIAIVSFVGIATAAIPLVTGVEQATAQAESRWVPYGNAAQAAAPADDEAVWEEGC